VGNGPSHHSGWGGRRVRQYHSRHNGKCQEPILQVPTKKQAGKSLLRGVSSLKTDATSCPGLSGFHPQGRRGKGRSVERRKDVTKKTRGQSATAKGFLRVHLVLRSVKTSNSEERVPKVNSDRVAGGGKVVSRGGNE